MAKRNSSKVVDSILDELDTARTEKETDTEVTFEQPSYEGHVCSMTEERHVERDSWLTLLIEGSIISH